MSIDKKNRHPYLNEDQAYELLRDALDEYDRALQHMPARIVIHKSSHFRESERKGFLRALDEKGIRAKDFVAITDTDIRLFGDGDYPPKRGTMLAISETEGVLCTRGTVDFYKTYPGAYVPKPLKVASPQALYAEQRFSGHNVNIGVRQRREGTGRGFRG